MYTISEISQLTKTTAHTIRYYEKEGLLFPTRTASGIRRYDDTQLNWLRFVLRLRATHMPIEQIREYVELFLASSETHDTSLERLRLLEVHQQNVRDQLAELAQTEQLIADKIAAYRKLHPSVAPEAFRST
ncbi:MULTISPECIES: MerR family transcriptional regulator [Exiguobacterium]|uniref:MerR family transcriptional regulator n=1 Tax=Exiguobacterium antarcticum TaxID=132920 RepID=A0ABT6R2N5_9BACL|nr:MULTISPECIES: MerR family transcriptional regulator [Exiguobacterium]AFS70422.1 Transcriptional regulator, MerR family [Exiguobacterium antarcticum B7]MCT4781229.1 MerR family transcriptional regulator [Exiguobacterium soli]MDI3235192.1 MerR family transcriptional regulator [Exiguobacterium antarcticum]